MQRRFRTVWISDTHLGTRGCHAEALSLFLKHVRCEKLYLVGDIIDMGRLRQKWYWPQRHNDVVRRILTHAKHGTEVIFVPGNHDDGARQYLGIQFGGVRVLPHAEHLTADGRKLFICHGDQYDLVVTHSPLLESLGGVAYDYLIEINRIYNWLRAKLGKPYMSLSQAVKQRVKQACTFVSRFEQALMREAQKRKVDGIVCGHIHKAEMRTTEGGVAYYNCGDWVESCSALVEHADGRMELLDGLAFVADFLDSAASKTLGEVELDAVPIPGRPIFLMPDQPPTPSAEEPSHDLVHL